MSYSLDTARYPTALYIYQEKPPIYKVVSNGEIHDVPSVRSCHLLLCDTLLFQGDHNLLDCLLLFVECVNANRNGHLGALNLSASGVDILWTISPPSS